MNEEWLQKTIGEVCVLRSGTTLPKEIEKPSGEIPYLKVADMNLGDNLNGITSSSRYVNKCDVNASNLLPAGTTIFPKRGGAILTNKKRLTERVICADLNIMGVTPKAGLLPQFIFYYFLALDLGEICNGTSIPQINNYTIEPLLISFPTSIPEQQRIVGILDEAFEGVATAKANAEKNLQNARALFDSHLQAVFSQRGDGWVEKRLQDVCEKITDGTHQTPTYFEDGVIFLSSKNVTSGKINWDDIKYIDTKQHLEMHKRVAPRMNDILLAKNGTTGVAAMVDRNVVFDIYVSLALIRSLGRVSPKFLLYFINSPVAKQQFNKRLKGIGVPNLHLQEIREVLVRFPDSEKEQNAIVAELDFLREETQRLESIYQQKLAALDALKKSLLDQAFKGEL